MQRIIDEQVDELLKNDCIEPSKSPHSAPIVLVGKKTGDVRMCIDYRQLNANSVPDAYPLPRIHHILERLRNARYISTLDLKRKCKFFQRSLVYLGHRISDEGIHTDPEKIAAVRKLQAPTTCRELRRCLGIASWINLRYHWPGLYRDVASYVKKCEKCQRFKVCQMKPSGRMLTRQVEEPFDTLCADFVGPLPRSKHGNTMLLVFFDAFSK
ncbi:hypothetical protein KR044_001630, partial [Drosophila immigrans]